MKGYKLPEHATFGYARKTTKCTVLCTIYIKCSFVGWFWLLVLIINAGVQCFISMLLDGWC